MRKHIIILLQLCVFQSLGYSKGINQDSIFDKASEYFHQKKFNLAALEYERAIFYLDDKKSINNLLLKKSYCNKMNGAYKQAILSLNRIELDENTIGLNDTVTYEKALNYFLLNDFLNAESLLLQLNSKGVNFSTYLLIVLLNEQSRWEEARDVFEEYLSFYKQPLAALDLYSFVGFEDLKKQQKAKMLSRFLPGLGQLSLNKPKAAFMSFFLNGLSGYFVVSSFIGGYFVTGGIMAVPLFLRFYFGGIQNVDRIIDEESIMLTRERNSILNHEIIKINLLVEQNKSKTNR